MSLKFSHAVGYRGVCALYPNLKVDRNADGMVISDAPYKKIGTTFDINNGVIVLCTGGSITLSQEPIQGSGVWGAGYANAAPIAYAWNYLSLQGNVSFELTQGPVWDALNKYAFTARTEDHWVTLLPDGTTGFCGPGWLSSLSFEASQGQAITGSFNFKGDPGDNEKKDLLFVHTYDNKANYNDIKGEQNKTVGTDGRGIWQGITSATEGPRNSQYGLAGATLIPYWMTGVYTPDGEISDVISWSCNYNSDIQMLKCCNIAHKSSAPISADYILLGEMSGDGNYTVFRLKGDFNPHGFHNEKQYLTFAIGKSAQNSVVSVTSTGAVNNAEKYIQIPLAIVNNGSTSMTTGASYVTSEFSFNALGDGINPIIKMGPDLTPTSN